MQRKKLYRVLKWGSYTGLVLLAYVLQTTTSLFTILGVKPLLVIPLAVCIAVFEGEFAGSIFGALAGLYCDLGAGQLFGFNGLILMICCFFAGFLVNVLMRNGLATVFILTGGVLLLRGFLDFFFNLAIWNYEGVSRVLLVNVLPVIGYSLAFTPLFYLLIRAMSGKFAELLMIE